MLEDDASPKVGKMNLDENIKTAMRFRIQQFPTVLIFKENDYYNFTREITQWDLEEFVESGSYSELPKKTKPAEITAAYEWYLYLRWWARNGPSLYPMETAAIALGALVLLLAIRFCCCRKTVQSPADNSKAPVSPRKPKRD
jgi:hypothetical protein